jgi:hypothetical protein
MAILKKEEKITPRLIHETVRHYQQKIEEMLGEVRMKRPREIKPVGDLADMDESYEADDFDDILITGTSGNDATSDIPRDKAGVDADAVQLAPVGPNNKPQVVPSSLSSGSQSKKLNKKPGPTHKKLSKDDLRNPKTRKGSQTRNGGSRKKDRYSRSPDEYLKRE